MSILPKTQKDFANPTYWKRFFEKQEAAFEWYGDYDQLSHIFEKYLKPSDSILQIGCGNSLLSEELYDNGFRNVRSIDTDAKVIRRHQTINATKRPQLTFECTSAAETGLADESVNVVIDKGTIDALLPIDGTPADRRLVADIFEEVERCLRPLGRFFIVTLAQEHIVRALTDHFLAGRRALIAVQKCDLADADFVMPVFVFVITRLKMPMPEQLSMKFIRAGSGRVENAADCDELLKLIEAEQELNWFKHHVSKNIVEDVSFEICDDVTGNPRYKLTIVDDLDTKTLRTMAAFIIPFGRESDWMFATAKGRKLLRQHCERDRLVVVGLFRAQTYRSVTTIQNELYDLLISLKPIGFTNTIIDFLSLGAVDVRDVIANGKSAISGEWSVEQIVRDDKLYRRLIFLSSSGLIQSEAEVIEAKAGKKTYRVKSDTLTCDHHRSMLTALNFRCRADGGEELMAARRLPLRLAVLGLGGGLFPRFLRENFPNAFITTVELDKEVVKIARKYFGLPPVGKHFSVIIEDALKFIEDVSAGPDDQKYDIIFVDLAGPVQEDGLSCPPSVFVTTETLTAMRNCLFTDKGVLALNLVTRDDDKSVEVKERMRAIFPALYSIGGITDVNEVLICPLFTTSTAPNGGVTGSTKDESQPAVSEWLQSHEEELRKIARLK